MGTVSMVQAGASIIAARAAQFSLNTPEGSRITGSLVSNLVGSGITPRPQHRNATVRGFLASEWLAWADHADADEMTDFYGLQAALVRDMIVHGDGLAVFVPHPFNGAPTLRRLHPEQLDRSKNQLLTSGGRIVQGVEFDASGRRVAYWLRPSAPGETPAGISLSAFRTPAGTVIQIVSHSVV